MMGKKPTLAAALGLSLGWMLAIERAAAQAPVGHRQPNASDVPASDSVRGDAAVDSQPSTPPRTKRSRARRAQSTVDVILKTPNICSNCNQ